MYRLTQIYSSLFQQWIGLKTNIQTYWHHVHLPWHALTIPFGSFWCRSAEQPQIRKSEYVIYMDVLVGQSWIEDFLNDSSDLNFSIFPQRFQRLELLHTLPVPWGQSGRTRLEVNSQLNRTHQRCHRPLQAQLPRRWGVMSEVPLEAPQVCPISFTYPNSCPNSIMRYPSIMFTLYNLSFMKSSYSGSRFCFWVQRPLSQIQIHHPTHHPSIRPPVHPSIHPIHPPTQPPNATHWFQSSNNPATSCHPSHRPSLRRSRLWRKLPCWS